MATTTDPTDPTIPITPPITPKKISPRTLALSLVPILLLAGVIALFVATNGAGLNVEPVVPIEKVQFERTILRPGQIELHVQNTSPKDVTIAQVKINDAIWPFEVSPGPTISRLGSAVVTLDYPWVEAQAYKLSLFSTNSIVFETAIPVATITATASSGTLWSFTLVGIYVGVIPVFLGMFWLPALRRLGPRAMLFLMAVSVGLLIFLGIDATGEAVQKGGELGGPFQGIGLVGIGIVGTFVLLDAISRRQMSVERGRSERAQRMTLASMIALGIGLHNLGEGLAIGAAYAVGTAALGAFLVIGFIIQNLAEGLGVVVPISKDKPSLRSLALLGLIAGGPAIIGTWVGGLISSSVLSVLFLAIGAGAVFRVAYQIGKQMIWKDAVKRPMPMPMTTFAGVAAGMLVLYVTGLLIK